MTELKRELRALDLAVLAGRKRQSPRTGFIHYFAPDPEAIDTIPLYENFCFVLGLFRLKTGESVLEGKELLSRLLCFQTTEGNFPTFIHDFPRAWDPHLALKIAPVLIYLLCDFSPVLGSELKQKIEESLSRALHFSHLRKSLPPIWEARLKACQGKASHLPILTNAADWFEWVVSAQILDKKSSFPIPYNANMQLFLGDPTPQEKGEPEPASIEYVLAEPRGFSPRLVRDHPHQMYASLLFPFTSSLETLQDFICQPVANGGGRIVWKGTSIHSWIIPYGQWEMNRVVVQLPETVDLGRNDVFELASFVDVSSETSLFIEGKKGVVFQLGEKVSIRTPRFQIDLTFELVAGEGEFCGHISRSNRPGQIACRGSHLYEAFDWQIGLRTLRRNGPCRVAINYETTDFE